MEDKKLDFSRPFLSVRRFGPPPAPSSDKCVQPVPPVPYYKSDLKSGPVRNPGTVPFTWERTPGRPKQESKALRPPSAPKLPPGRALNGNESTPSKPQIKNVISCANDSDSDSSSEEEEEEGSSDSRDSEEAYLDAVDTLSRSESFFLNCSVSGVSGLDSPDPNPTAPVDSQARELMMSRFLPAAKAMVSKSPRYAAYRRRPAAQDEEREEVQTVGNFKACSLPRYGQYRGREEDSEEEEEEECDESAVACGLFSRLCLGKSVFLLNSIPGASVRTPVTSVRRLKAKPPHGISPHEKGQTTFHELLGIPAAEKTLQLDSNSNSNVLGKEGLDEADGNDLETPIEARVVEEAPAVESPVGDDHGSNVVDKEPMLEQKDILQCVDSSLPSSMDEKVQMPRKRDSEIPPNPPLPKSPSNSGLWRKSGFHQE